MMSTPARSILALVALAVVIAACETKQQPAEPTAEPVVVYAAYAEGSYLAELFSAFTDATGVRVAIRFGESPDLTDNVVSDRGSPPADVLITGSIVDIWRAADAGALRPLTGENLTEVPAPLRDPDGFWAASGVKASKVLFMPEASADVPGAYADLANSEYRGRLCLSTSMLPRNRSLIAMMIADLGVRPAERIVRGWVRNLAVPPLDTDYAVVDAVEAGECDFGIVSSQAASYSSVGDGDMKRSISPQPAYADIEGVGVARHARNPEAAQRLVDWMLSHSAQHRHSLGVFHYASRTDQLKQDVAERLSDTNVGQAGWLDEDARLLAERAGYR